MKIVIRNGRAKFVYDDDAHAVLSKLGRVWIARASSVEYSHMQRGWMATIDLRNITNDEATTVLGPFTLRDDALAAERAWIEAHL